MKTLNEFIPLSVPTLKGNELKYVTEAIETEWVSTAGAFVQRFEEAIASYVKVDGAVACQSGTAGLHVALEACGIGEGDEVLVPTLTFIATVNPVKYVQAEPVFIDCDESLTIDVKKLINFCTQECRYENSELVNKITNRRIKAIIVMHTFGNMADMESIMRLADCYGLIIIEDAAEALGTVYTAGKYKGKHAGTIGDIGIYSFNGNKIITTGGGGMIVSNDQKLLKQSRHLTTQAKIDEIYYLHDEIGFNYRMTNIQAALGLAQFERLEEFIQTKTDNYEYYQQKIDKIDYLRLLPFNEKTRSNRWFYSLYIEDGYRLNRDELIQYLMDHNIQVRPIWGLIHEQKPYQSSQKYDISRAEIFQKHIVNLPCSSTLTTGDIDKVCSFLMK